MKVLVTGATGFVGQNLVDYLLEQGLEVRALVRNPKKASELPKKVELIEGDVTNLQSVIDASKEVDSVFHLAGVVGYSRAERKQMEEFWATPMAPMDAPKMAAEAKKRP